MSQFGFGFAPAAVGGFPIIGALQRSRQARIIACIAELTDNLRGDAALPEGPENTAKASPHRFPEAGTQ